MKVKESTATYSTVVKSLAQPPTDTVVSVTFRYFA